MTKPIEQLRDEIAVLDSELLELLVKRFDLAAEVGRLKAERDQAVVVKEVEARVLSRARRAADPCGTSPAVMEAIYSAIIRGSVERQHRVGVEWKARGGARILVLGACGGMGRWLRRFLGSIGHVSDGVDPAWSGRERERGQPEEHFEDLEQVGDLAAYDAIFVAVPLVSAPGVLESLRAFSPLPPVFEVTSIKTEVEEPLRNLRQAGTEAISLHPMFGPGKGLYEELTVVHPVLTEENAERDTILRILQHPYLNLVSLPFAEHDRLMGWLLGLSHLTGILFAVALTRSGLEPAMLAECASTSFARQVATSVSVLEANNPDLYYAIQRQNPFRGEVYAALTAALGDLTGAVERADQAAFARMLEVAGESLPRRG